MNKPDISIHKTHYENLGSLIKSLSSQIDEYKKQQNQIVGDLRKQLAPKGFSICYMGLSNGSIHICDSRRSNCESCNDDMRW